MIPDRNRLDLTTRRRSVRRGYLWLFVLPFLLYLGGLALFPLLRTADPDARPLLPIPSYDGGESSRVPWARSRSRGLLRPGSPEAEARSQRIQRGESHIDVAEEAGFQGVAGPSASRGAALPGAPGTSRTPSGSRTGGGVALDGGSEGPQVLGAMDAPDRLQRDGPSGSLEGVKGGFEAAWNAMASGMRSLGFSFGDGGAASRGPASEGFSQQALKAGRLQDSTRSVTTTITTRVGSASPVEVRPLQELQGAEIGGRAAAGAKAQETAAAFAGSSFEGEAERQKVLETPGALEPSTSGRPETPSRAGLTASGASAPDGSGSSALIGQALQAVTQPSLSQGGQSAANALGLGSPPASGGPAGVPASPNPAAVPCGGQAAGTQWKGGCCCQCADPSAVGPGC